MKKLHHYNIRNTWTGNYGLGTKDYKSYNRSYDIGIDGKENLAGSADPSFRGDPSKHNPEEMFLASIASCHMLWFLHLCSVNGVIVTQYIDDAIGSMLENKDGSGKFTEVILKPKVMVTEFKMIEIANQLHEKASQMCFIANSCNFPITHETETVVTLP